jgi:hypothetical protein
MVPMKARLLAVLNWLDGTGRRADSRQATQDPTPQPLAPAVRTRLLELDRAGYSIDYLEYAAHQMRTGGTVRTSR